MSAGDQPCLGRGTGAEKQSWGQAHREFFPRAGNELGCLCVIIKHCKLYVGDVARFKQLSSVGFESCTMVVISGKYFTI